MRRIWGAIVAAATRLGADPGATPDAPGWTRAIAAFAGIALAVPLSGPARLFGASSMMASLAIVALLALFAAVALWPLIGFDPRPWWRLAAALVGATAIATFVLTRLAAPYFGGLPAMNGGDGGLHLATQLAFTATGEHDYHGIVTTYATAHWLARAFDLDTVAMYRAVFEVSVVAATWVAVAASGWFASGATAAQRLVVAAIGMLAAGVVTERVALPLLNAYQCDGFFPQVFGLVPLVVTGLAYAGPRRRALRLLALALGIGFYRFTYVLNAGDLLLVVGLLVAVESRDPELERSARRGLRVLAVVCVLLGVAAYASIFTVAYDDGGFARAPLAPEISGLAVLAAAFFAAAPAARALGSPLGLPGQRLTRFLGGMCAAPALVMAGWLAADQPASYYLRKYGFAAEILGALAAGPLAVGLGSRVVAALRRRRVRPPAAIAGTATALAAVLGAVALWLSASAYWDAYRERVDGTPPWRRLRPLAEPAVVDRMREVLATEHAGFGGFFTPSWPESQFTNATMGMRIPTLYFVGREPPTRPGRCIFWYDTASRPRRGGRWRAETLAMIAALEIAPGHRCDPVQLRSDPTRSDARLCHACFAPE